MNNKRIHELLEWVKERNKPHGIIMGKDQYNKDIVAEYVSDPFLEILQHLLEVDIQKDPGGRAVCGDCDGDLALDTTTQCLMDPSGGYHDCKNGLSSDEYRVIKEYKSQQDKENDS
jgi:hypothetical protein